MVSLEPWLRLWLAPDRSPHSYTANSSIRAPQARRSHRSRMWDDRLHEPTKFWCFGRADDGHVRIRDRWSD